MALPNLGALSLALHSSEPIAVVQGPLNRIDADQLGDLLVRGLEKTNDVTFCKTVLSFCEAADCAREVWQALLQNVLERRRRRSVVSSLVLPDDYLSQTKEEIRTRTRAHCIELIHSTNAELVAAIRGAEVPDIDAALRSDVNPRGADMPRVKVALDAGADPNHYDADGFTPLAYAVRKGHLPQAASLVQRLIAAGADPNLYSRGTVPAPALFDAASYGYPGVVTVLLNAKANPDATNGVGKTALHNAALRGMVASARLLLNAGAFVDAADHQGLTPLFSTMLQPEFRIRGHVEVFNLLIQNNADVNHKSHAEKTLLDFANALAYRAIKHDEQNISLMLYYLKKALARR